MGINTWSFLTSRTIFDSEIWWKPAEWLKIWIYIIWNVNYQDSRLFPRWSNFFQYSDVARECNCSYRTVENCLKYLKVVEQIWIKKTARGVVIDVKNYDLYQSISSYTSRTTVETTVETDVETGVRTINKETNKTKETNKETIDTIVSSQAMVEMEIIEKIEPIERGNPEINQMQGFLRQAVWVTQFKDSKERWYVAHCLNLMKKIWEEEFKTRLKSILSDPFKAKNSNKLAYLYWELKAYIHSPIIQTQSTTPNYGGLYRKPWFDD